MGSAKPSRRKRSCAFKASVVISIFHVRPQPNMLLERTIAASRCALCQNSSREWALSLLRALDLHNPGKGAGKGAAMDQIESKISHLHLQRVLQCVNDAEPGALMLDLQTEDGIVRLHCEDRTWHALLECLDGYSLRQDADHSEREPMALPSILRFLNTTQKSGGS